MWSASKQSENKRYVILFNHENPYIGRGGTERYIVDQAVLYKNQEVDVLVLFPLDLRAILGIPFVHGWGVVENSCFRGIKSVRQVIELINAYNREKECAGVYIHNIIDLDIDELDAFISFRKKVTLFVHDFCTCCKQINLRKNLENFCGDSLLYDEKCSDCRFYEKSKKLHAELEAFFAKIPVLRVIAPSESAARLWAESYPDYKENVEIIPHLIPEGVWRDERGEIKPEDKIHIAFVGSAIPQKGWNTFADAVAMLQKTQKVRGIELYYLGQSRKTTEGVIQVYVSTHEKGDHAMIDALRMNRIDAVILFSNCPETYSFTYYESLAANCFVITNKLSGNIAHETKKRGNGVVIENSSRDLADLLSDPDLLRESINAFRAKCTTAPLAYSSQIQATIETDDEPVTGIRQDCKSSRLSAFNANLAYRIRYSAAFTKIMPVYIAPKETADRFVKTIKQRLSNVGTRR